MNIPKHVIDQKIDAKDYFFLCEMHSQEYKFTTITCFKTF